MSCSNRGTLAFSVFNAFILNDFVAVHLTAAMHPKPPQLPDGPEKVSFSTVLCICASVADASEESQGGRRWAAVHRQSENDNERRGGRAGRQRTVESVDKCQIPFPICSGVPGLGKTRMLEDWNDMFFSAIKAASDAASHSAVLTYRPDHVLVNYYNGHSLQECEMGAPIITTFLWRLLFDYFLWGRGSDGFGNFMARMMAKDLIPTIDTILHLIAESHGDYVTVENPLCLFLGVDEYQTVNKLQQDDGAVPYARQLANMIGAYMAEPSGKVILLPMFAVTYFDVESGSVAKSSCVDTKRLPMSVLSPGEVQTMLTSHPIWGQELDTLFLSVVLLGDIPQFAVEYGKLFLNLPFPRSVDALNTVFGEVWNTRSAKWSTGLPSELLLVIAALAITNTAVKEDDSVTVREESWSWTKLVDTGVCILEPLAIGEYHIVVPYSVFRHCGQFGALTTNSLPVSHQYLSKCLNYMMTHVDNRVYDCEPWQLWETFGACFHAARINSFLVLGETVVSVSRLFEGGNQGSTTQVVLHPMEVFRSAKALSTDIGETVVETGNASHSRRWIGVDSGYDAGVVVINGAGGAGVDIFFSLLIEYKDAANLENYMIFLDQRKQEAKGTLSLNSAKSLIKKARDAYSRHASIQRSAQTKAYHGSFWSHPAACPFVDVQEDNTLTLCLLLQNSKESGSVAEDIIAKRGGTEAVSTLAKLKDVAHARGAELIEDASVWALF
eukprot:scaffold100981_cov55-Attheya_sp.AAC.3